MDTDVFAFVTFMNINIDESALGCAIMELIFIIVLTLDHGRNKQQG